MPSFLKDLSIRRRSKASYGTAETGGSSGNSSNDGDANERRRNKSSSTLSSWLDKSSPPTTLSSEKSKSSTHLPTTNGNGSKAPPVPTATRPRLQSSHSNRYSLVGMPVQNGESVPKPTPATSPYAPRVLSVSDGSWVRILRSQTNTSYVLAKTQTFRKATVVNRQKLTIVTGPSESPAHIRPMR